MLASTAADRMGTQTVRQDGVRYRACSYNDAASAAAPMLALSGTLQLFSSKVDRLRGNIAHLRDASHTERAGEGIVGVSTGKLERRQCARRQMRSPPKPLDLVLSPLHDRSRTCELFKAPPRRRQ